MLNYGCVSVRMRIVEGGSLGTAFPQAYERMAGDAMDQSPRIVSRSLAEGRAATWLEQAAGSAEAMPKCQRQRMTDVSPALTTPPPAIQIGRPN